MSSQRTQTQTHDVFAKKPWHNTLHTVPFFPNQTPLPPGASSTGPSCAWRSSTWPASSWGRCTTRWTSSWDTGLEQGSSAQSYVGMGGRVVCLFVSGEPCFQGRPIRFRILMPSPFYPYGTSCNWTMSQAAGQIFRFSWILTEPTPC